MAIDDSPACTDCGSPLPVDAPPKVCPRCCLRAALVGESEEYPLDAEDAVAVPSIAREDRAWDGATPRIQRFGDYELLEEIARGGMGIVYRARQISLDRVVAVKLLPFGTLSSAEFIKRFRAEASAAAALRHPNIVTVHEVGVHQGQHYLVMNFVNGPPLSRLVADGPLDARRASSYLKRIAEAVHYAHEKGILHRDLKPSNVLIDADDEAQVTDFGLAKRLDGDSSLTVTGQALGSPGYMPPEQALAEHSKVTRRSDVYGLGAMLYHLITGRPPFQASTLHEAIRQVAEFEPPLPRLLNPSIPCDLETICRKCLEREPERRYATAQGVADELGRFLAGEPVRARPVGALGRTWRWCRRRPVLAGLSLALVFTFFAGLVGIVWQWNRAVANEQLTRQNAYAADIKLAQQSLEEGDLGTALELLNKHRPESSAQDLRGWEWRHLWSLCQSDEQRTLVQYPSWVGSVSVSADGTTLAVQRDDRIALWNLKKHQEITNLTASGFQGTVAFAPTGALLAAANSRSGGEPEVILWDLRDLTTQVSLPHEASVLSLVFSSDGKFLATRDSRKIIRIWDTETTDLLVDSIAPRSVEGLEPFPSADVLQFSPDGSLLVFQEDISSLQVVDWRKRIVIPMNLTSQEPSRNDPRLSLVSSIAVSPSGLLAWGLGNGTIRLWDMSNWESKGELTGHTDAVLTLEFSPDGQRLVSAGGDQTIRIWDPIEHREIGNLRGHEQDVWTLDFLNNGTLLSGGKDGTVRMWDMMDRSSKSSHVVLPILLAKFSQDSQQMIALLSGEEPLGRWEIPTFDQTETYAEFGARIFYFGLSANEQWFAMAHWDENTVQIWDWKTKRHVTDLIAPAKVWKIGFTPDDRKIWVSHSLPERAARDLDNAVTWKLWEVGSWNKVDVGWIKASVRAGDLSPDSRKVAFGHETGEIELHSFPDGRLIGSFAGYPSRVSRLRFSPDGRLLASTSNDGFVKIWDVRTQAEIMELRSRFTQVSVEFSPDGKRLAVGNEGDRIQPQHVRLWDLTTRRELLMLVGAAYTVSFSPDGNMIFAMEQVSGGWRTHFWPAPSWEEIEEQEASANLR